MSKCYPRNIEPNSLVEITTHTPMGQYLLVPSMELNEIIVGVLGYPLRQAAERRLGVRLCGVHVSSNRLTILGIFEDTDHMSDYFELVLGKLSKEVRRLVGDHIWPGSLWAGHFEDAQVSTEPEAQIARLKHLLGQGVMKEKDSADRFVVVDRPAQWPGVHSAEALATGEPLVGRWFSRTAESKAERRNRKPSLEEYSEEVKIHLAPLPCWEHLPAEEVRRRASELIRQIEAEAEMVRRTEKRVRKTSQQIEDLTKVSYTKRPEIFDPDPAPLIHAFKDRVREQYRKVRQEIVRAYREAAQRLRAGERNVAFPAGTFPPGLPFEPAVAARPP